MTIFSAASGSISKLVFSWINRFIAVDWAAHTSPLISAPVKFLVFAAKAVRSTSGTRSLCSFILAVCISRNLTLPFSSGKSKKVDFHVMKSKWHLILCWSSWLWRGPIFACMMVKGYHCRTWDWVEPLFCDLCKVEEHCASESPIKETCWNCGGFACLVRACTCIVGRLSFVHVRLLRLFQQTSQRAMLFRISLKMGPLTIHSFSIWPMWDTWAPYCVCLCGLVHS